MARPERTPPALAAAAKARIKSCPRCACGIQRESHTCRYCGAHLGILPDQTPGVTAVDCLHCGTANHPTARSCFRCRAELVHTCPSCRAEVAPSLAADCRGCGLARGQFLLHCTGIAEAKLQTQAEHARFQERRGLTRLTVFSAGSTAVLAAGVVVALVADHAIGVGIMLASLIPLAAALVLAVGTRQDPQRRRRR